MNESERLAQQLERALNGNAWYGPSWREALDGVTREAALRRPIPEAHTIAEIVLHATTWQDVVRRRLAGETPSQPTDAEDWPSGQLGDDRAWEAATKRLFDTGRGLGEAMAKFPPERLVEPRPGVDGIWYDLLVGVLQHVLYHAGQVALLRKASAR
jgi:hypothetical protein